MSHPSGPSDARVAAQTLLGVVVGGVLGVLLGHYGFGQGWTASVVTLAPVMIVIALVLYWNQRR